MRNKTIYILLTHTGTRLTRLIKSYTKKQRLAAYPMISNDKFCIDLPLYVEI